MRKEITCEMYRYSERNVIHYIAQKYSDGSSNLIDLFHGRGRGGLSGRSRVISDHGI